VVVCLEQGADNSMIYIYINSMTYTLFFILDYQFQEVFLCFNVIIFLLFLWRPLSCGGPWAIANFAPPP